MDKVTLFISLFLTLSPSIRAEYRVYQYTVQSNLKLNYDATSYQVTSTLDPISYQSYHGGKSSLKVDLIRTWTCKGNTSKKEICSSPEKLALLR